MNNSIHNIMPLTLQHICQYLPYGLKAYVFDDPAYLVKYLSYCPEGRWAIPITPENLNDRIFKDGYKPIVRPLSDITSQITHKGTELVISELFEIGDDGGYNLEFDHGNIKLIKQLELIADHSIHHDVQFLPHDVAKLLHSYFIDTCGLIEAGLAISTHDLKEDPYK